MQPCTYIIFSVKLNKYYIGSTTDIDRRLTEHNRGKEKFTRTGMPWILVNSEIYADLKEARKRELYIKNMKSRKYIEALIASNSHGSDE